MVAVSEGGARKRHSLCAALLPLLLLPLAAAALFAAAALTGQGALEWRGEPFAAQL